MYWYQPCCGMYMMVTDSTAQLAGVESLTDAYMNSQFESGIYMNCSQNLCWFVLLLVAVVLVCASEKEEEKKTPLNSTCTLACTHARTHTHACTHTHTHLCTCTYTHTPAHTHTEVQIMLQTSHVFTTPMSSNFKSVVFDMYYMYLYTYAYIHYSAYNSM